MKTSLTFLVLLIASLLVGSVAQAQDVGAAVVLIPPYSGRVSDYTDLSNNDQVFVDLDNPGNTTLSFYLLGRITRNGAPFVAMDNNFRPVRPIVLAPGELLSFDGSTLADLNLNFDVANVVGLTGAQQSQILLDDALPEGEYEICLRAFDFDSRTPLTINGAEEYCSLSFAVVQGGYAELITPEDGETFDPDIDDEVFISWAYNGTENGAYDLRYTVKLIDLTEHNIDPSTATLSMFDPGVPVLYETDPGGTSDYSYSYGFDPVDPPLVAGHVYAVRVTAFEAEDLLYFPQGGHSQVHVFSFGTPDGGGASCVDPAYRIQAVYPMAGDTLPFNYTPCVARVDPLCDDYRLFEFSLDLNAAEGAGYDRTEDNRWGSVGPVGYLSNLLGTAVTRERASHFVFNLEDEQTAAMGQLRSGLSYDWNVSTTMHQRGGNTMTGVTASQEWVHGMPRPRLQTPAHESVVAPGEVRLTYRTGDAPNTLLPAHLNLIRAAGIEVLGQQSMGNVTESCVIQVSRSDTFSAANLVTHQLVDVSLANFSGDGAAISAALYKSLNFSVTAVDTGDYFWRVVWLVDPSIPVASSGELSDSDVYHASSTWKFTIDADGETETPETPEPANTDCSSNCIVAAPASTGALSTLAVDETFLMGKFTVTVKEVSGSTTFNGEGEVVIPFANDIKIRVGFTGVKINSDRKAYTGLVTALEDEHPFNVSQQLGVGGQSIPSLPQNELALLNDFLDDGERLVSGFAGRRTIGLPIGIDRDFSGHRVTLGVVKMVFEPTVAKLDVVCAFPIPDFDDYIGLGVGDWCFNPDGLGNEGRVFMADDLTLNAGDDIEFSISGGSASDTTQITYAEFDCSGIVCLQLRGELRFDTSMIKPDPVTSTAPDEEVTAFLRAKICWQDGLDFLAQAHIDAFVVPDADKFTFKETDIWIDFSDRENPNPMSVPDGYRWAGSSARERNTWKGVYIPRVLMSIPREVVDDPSYEVGVDNFIIDYDPFAISVRAVAINLVPEGEANIDGWGITVDTVYLAMIQTRDVEAGIKGRLEMPLTDEGEHLLYRAAINTSGVEIGVSVDPRDPLTAPIMAAELILERNTYLNIYLGTNSGIAANLNGEISITGDQARSQASSGSSPSMNMPGVKFQGVGFDTRAGTSSSGTWRFASPQKSAVGFPLQIDSMGLDLSNLETPGFFIKPRLTLMGDDGGISGAAMLHFHARNVTVSGGRKKWKLDRVSLSEINLDVEISKVALKGYIRWTESETVEEIAGGIDITIPMGIKGKMNCTFGTYRGNQTATFGTAQYYSYWQVDGLIQFNPGLQIFSGFAIYGVGGGVSYHMRRDGNASTGAIRSAPETAGTAEGGNAESTEVANTPQASGVRYIADHSKCIGLELTLILGTFPKPDAFNADITLRAEFENAGGLSLLQLRGDGYFMTGINERASSNKMVWAALDISYRPLDEELHGTFDVFLDVAGVLVGNASEKRMVNATIHVDPSMWYFHLGTYRDRGGIALTVGGEPLANLTEYLMIGHGVPVDLPEIEHDRLRNLLSAGGNSGGGSNNVESDEDAINAQRAEGYASETDKLHEGKGFAFGTAFSTSGFINPVPIYLAFEIALGMDALVAQVPEGLVCAETGERPGANGWRVAGQVYAGIWGELGIGVKIIRRFTIPIVSLAAGFQLQAKVPNPNYFAGVAAVEYSVLGGAISGRKRMAFEFGADCELISNDPLANIQVLESIGPNGQQSVYAQAAATFNFPINKILELPRTIPNDGPPTFWRFKPYISSWTIKKGSTPVVTEAIKVKEGGYLATLEPTSVLDQFSNFRSDISLRFTNLTAGANEVYRNPETNAIHQEDSTATFRTGMRPIVLPKEQVRYTYPIANQRHFLPGVTDRKGILSQTRGHDYLFYRQRDGNDYDYVLRYIPLGDGEPVDVPQGDLQGRELNFQVTEGLLTETIYSVQLLRIKRKTAAELAQAQMAELNLNVANAGLGNLTAYNQPTHMQALTRQNFAGGDYRVVQTTREVNHTDVERPDFEFKLFQWYFRTSKFNDLNEKLASLSLTGQTPHNGMGSYGAYVRGSLDEHFDQYEVNGYYHDGVRVLPPLVKFIPNLGDDYYSYQITNTYARLSRMRRFRQLNVDIPYNGMSISAALGQPAVPATDILSWINAAIASDYYLDRDRSWVVQPIQPGEISNASSVTTATSVGTMSLGQQHGISANTGGFSLGTATGGFNFGGGGLPPASQSYNFGLVFRAPWRVDRDLQAVRNYTSRLIAQHVGIENRNGTLLIYHRHSGSSMPSSSAVDVSIIPSLRSNHPNEYYTLRSLSTRHWREVAAFTNQTPRLPIGSEFSAQQSNRYRVRITYAVPSLGQQSLSRTFNLTTNEAPTNAGLGPF
ncbi:MAG: hypothetical protein AB8F78_09895 [Saprospiraceae bacterium]